MRTRDPFTPHVNPSTWAILALGGCVLTGTLMTGCHSPAYVKGDTAAWTLQMAAADVRANSRNLETTMTALNDLVNRPASDLRLQFHQFSTVLDQLTASSKRTSDTSSRLERKQKAYFEAWDRELAAINDEEIRKTSEARKAEVSKQFEATNRKQQEAQDALVPLVGYLDDIRRGFTADLTTAGLQAAKPATAEANNKKAIVQANLAQAASDLEALGGRMSSYLVTEGDKHTH
jgi:hypothetical protein